MASGAAAASVEGVAELRRQTKNTPNGSALSLLILANLGFALKGIFVRLAIEAGSTPDAVFGLRVMVGSPLFWSLGLLAGGPLPDFRVAVGAVACGVFYVVAAYSDLVAIDALGAGPSRMVLFTYPGWLLVIAAVWDRRRPAGRAILGCGLAWLGLAAVLLGGADGTDGSGEGAAWGLVAAGSYALYLRLAQGFTPRLGALRFAALANIGTFIGGVLLVLVLDTDIRSSGANQEVLGWVVLLSIVSTVVPFILIFEGIRRVGAAAAGIVSFVAPVMTLVFAALLIEERLAAFSS